MCICVVSVTQVLLMQLIPHLFLAGESHGMLNLLLLIFISLPIHAVHIFKLNRYNAGQYTALLVSGGEDCCVKLWRIYFSGDY